MKPCTQRHVDGTSCKSFATFLSEKANSVEVRYLPKIKKSKEKLKGERKNKNKNKKVENKVR
jgi:hypothetical protein